MPRRGLEPPRIAPLVPETSASTSSATWAGGGRLARGAEIYAPIEGLSIHPVAVNDSAAHEGHDHLGLGYLLSR